VIGSVVDFSVTDMVVVLYVDGEFEGLYVGFGGCVVLIVGL
jgi:hypothetical protein